MLFHVAHGRGAVGIQDVMNGCPEEFLRAMGNRIIDLGKLAAQSDQRARVEEQDRRVIEDSPKESGTCASRRASSIREYI